jgi:hypothetical protein
LCSVFLTKYYWDDQIKKMKKAGHVARMGREEVHTWFWWRNLGEGDSLEDPGVNGRVILIRIFEKWDGGRTESIWLRTGRVCMLL